MVPVLLKVWRSMTMRHLFYWSMLGSSRVIFPKSVFLMYMKIVTCGSGYGNSGNLRWSNRHIFQLVSTMLINIEDYTEDDMERR